MKLLFDENTSPKLPRLLAGLILGRSHVRECGFLSRPDEEIWEYARANGFTLVSKDSDFQQRSLLYGHPPKVIWVRLGNLAVFSSSVSSRFANGTFVRWKPICLRRCWCSPKFGASFGFLTNWRLANHEKNDFQILSGMTSLISPLARTETLVGVLEVRR